MSFSTSSLIAAYSLFGACTIAGVKSILRQASTLKENGKCEKFQDGIRARRKVTASGRIPIGLGSR
jgi:hypothetical protein